MSQVVPVAIFPRAIGIQAKVIVALVYPFGGRPFLEQSFPQSRAPWDAGKDTRIPFRFCIASKPVIRIFARCLAVNFLPILFLAGNFRAAPLEAALFLVISPVLHQKAFGAKRNALLV